MRRAAIGLVASLSAGLVSASGCGLDWVMPPEEEGGAGAGAEGGANTFGHGGKSSSESTTASTAASGGAASSTAATTTSTSATTSTASSGAGGMPISCPQDDCANCTTCAVNGSCGDEYATCDDNPSCVDLWNCYLQCDVFDSVCTGGCYASYPAGQNDFDAEFDCYCMYCFNACVDCSL